MWFCHLIFSRTSHEHFHTLLLVLLQWPRNKCPYFVTHVFKVLSSTLPIYLKAIFSSIIFVLTSNVDASGVTPKIYKFLKNKGGFWISYCDWTPQLNRLGHSHYICQRVLSLSRGGALLQKVPCFCLSLICHAFSRLSPPFLIFFRVPSLCSPVTRLEANRHGGIEAQKNTNRGGGGDIFDCNPWCS